MNPPKPTPRPGKKEITVVNALEDYTAGKEGDLVKCKVDEKEGLLPGFYVAEKTSSFGNVMHEAVKRGNLAFVSDLISNGISVNSLDMVKNTPLHYACRSGHLEIVKLLLDQNATVNSQNKDTPLHYAAFNGNTEIVSTLLLSDGIDARILNKAGESCIKTASNDQVASILMQFLNNHNAVESDDD